MPKLLTDVSIKQMKPGRSRKETADAVQKGLYLYVQPSGAKSWVVLLTEPIPGLKGKYVFRKLRLGPVDLMGGEAVGTPELGDPMTLAGARNLVAEMQHERKRGRNAIADRRAKKQMQKLEANERNAKLFAAVAEQFIAEYARPETRRWKETAHILGLDYERDNDKEPTRIKGGLAERWQDKEITQITSDDVYRVVDEAKRHGTPGLPRRTNGISNSRGRAVARTLSKLFGWALQHRKIKVSPSVGVFVPPAPKSRDRVLSADEIILFWNATDKVAEPFGPMLKLLLLTGARLREVAGMRRSELSEDGATWTLPGSRTKNKRDFIVPLPPMARIIVASVKQIEAKPGYIFSTTGASPVSGFSKLKRRMDELLLASGVEIPPWRLHDLRRTFSTMMNESSGDGGLGIAPHIVEACINHISGGAKDGVAGTYNKAKYLPEKRVALERWAMHLEGLVKGRPANVMPMRRTGK